MGADRCEQYSSGDFARVPDRLSADLPGKLLHRDVGGYATTAAPAPADAAANAFSRQRKHLVRVVDLPSRVLSMTLGGLEPGQSTNRHRHNYETMIYVVTGSGHSLIGERRIDWQAGDALYVPVWAWHQHVNDHAVEKALYVACENAPMLQNLGVALREEG
ncbi:cupin domain-containing protein [soil metagenome]